MASQYVLYVSAAGDLRAERAALGQVAATLPVTLSWKIVLSPLVDGPLDRLALAQSDTHVVLLASDIRAPIGLEWLLARRAGILPLAFRKARVARTIAVSEFERQIGATQVWTEFRSSTELRVMVQRLLADDILRRARHFSLTVAEIEKLRAWRAGLDQSTEEALPDGSTDASAVILSAERFEPSDGVLLTSPLDSD